MATMRAWSFLVAASAVAVHGMSPDPSCHSVLLDCGKSACVYQHGTPFQHWFATEEGHSLCRGVDGRYLFASAEGSSSGLACSSEALTCARRRPSFPVSPMLAPPSNVAPEVLEAQDSDSFYAQLVRERAAGGRQLLTAASPKRLKNLVLLIRWADSPEALLPPRAAYDIMMSNAGPHPLYAPSGSVADNFNSNMYGKIVINTTVVGWIPSNYTHAQATGSPKADGSSCGGTCSNVGEGKPKLHPAISEALAYADANGYDIGSFDGDGDGKIDIFTVIHSGHGAETGAVDSKTWIWSHKWTLTYPYTSRGATRGKRIVNYNISPGLWGETGFNISHIGVVAHESMHYLGLPDLYDTTYTSRGVGTYDLMANSWGYDRSQLYPPSLGPWGKKELGVIDVVEIGAQEGLISVPSQATDQGSVLKLSFKSGSTTYADYLLIENRQPIGFDRYPDLVNGGFRPDFTGGILVWHVDPNMGSNSAVGYPGSGWPQKHYKVRLIQADGRFDLEKNVNKADQGDWFVAGSVNGTQVLDDLSSPSLNGYSLIAGNKCSGHRLSDFSFSKSVMTFRYTKMSQACTGLPVNTQAPTPASSTSAPTPASTTTAPTPASTTRAPTPASTTKAPTTASPTRAPTPAITTTAPPTTASTTVAPTVASTTTAPSALPTVKCNPSYFNANDGCDCGCGWASGGIDPDCTKGDAQSKKVYCDGSSTANRNAVCSVEANKCVAINGAPADTETGNQGVSFVAGDSKVGAPMSNSGTSLTTYVGAAVGSLALIALGAVLVVRRRRAGPAAPAPVSAVANPRYVGNSASY